MSILFELAAALQIAGPLPVVAVVPTAPVDWRTEPLSPGRWRYTPVAGGSEAVWTDYANIPQFRIACSLTTRLVTISRPGGGAPLTVSTTGLQRTVVGALGALDPLLDQMAFSRGRFAIAAPGARLLVVPSFAEPARAIEDCRK